MNLGKLAPGCPNCGKGRYGERDIAWLGIKLMMCFDCGYSSPVVEEPEMQNPDTRITHDTGERDYRIVWSGGDIEKGILPGGRIVYNDQTE